MKPLASLIIVNYNGFEITKKCLESLWQSSPDIDFETIVVDNASADQSLEKLSQLFPESKRLKYLARQSNDFLAPAYNDGAELSQGEILVFMNNDLVFTSGWLKELLRTFEFEKIGIAGSAILSFKSKQIIDNLGGRLDVFGFGQRIDAGKEYKPNQDFRSPFYIQGALLAIRRPLFEKIKRFDPDYQANYEDVDLCWKTRLLGYQIYIAQKSVVYHLGSWTVNKYLKKENSSFLCRKNRLTTLLKNGGIIHLVLVLPFYFLSQLALFLKEFFLDRNVKLAMTAFRAVGWNIANFQNTLKKRREIQKLRKVSGRQILKEMSLF